MSILKDVCDRLGHRSPSGFRTLPPLRGASFSYGYILDYGTRMAALGPERPPTLSLSGRSFTFLKGRWVSSSHGEDSGSRSEAHRLRQKKQALQEKHDALKLRLELLMELLIEATAQLGGLRQERGAGKRPLPKRVMLVTRGNSFRQ